MNIRPLQNGDQNLVHDVMKQHQIQFPKFIKDIYPERWDKYLVTNNLQNSGYYVGIKDNLLVGHAGYIFNDKLGCYEIVGVVVAKEYQRNGIGKALIETICDKIFEMNENKVVLYTLDIPANEPTLTFYKSIGFDLVQHEKDFFAPGYHRVKFEKKLGELEVTV